MIARTACFVALLLLAFPGAAHAEAICGPRQVAFSFDDPPWPDSAVMTGEERVSRILAALDEGGVEGAMFFAVSSRIDGENIYSLERYARAGHRLASHSHTHANLHNVGTDAFAEDIKAADRILRPFPGFRPFFRFPYLNEGNTEAQRDEIRDELAGLGYRQGYVTIDNFDFVINRLLVDATLAGADIDHDAAAAMYVSMIMGAADHYDAVACRWLGRSPNHVLLLHENDAAALYLPALIEAFKADGWTIIPAELAYADPIAETMPATLFLGQGRVAAIAAEMGADPATLRHEGENADVLADLWSRTVISPRGPAGGVSE